MGVFPPVCKAMSADGLRLAFVLVCVSSIVLKVYSPCGLYVQNLTGAQTCKNTPAYLGLANSVSHLEEDKLIHSPLAGIEDC